MPAITAASISVQRIAPLPSQTALTDQPKISCLLNRAQGKVALIIRDWNKFDDMSAVFAFYSEPDQSRPYSFKLSDGILQTRCHVDPNGEVVMRFAVGSLRPDGEPSDGVFKARCHVNQHGAVLASFIDGPVQADRRAASGDLSSSSSSRARLRDNYLSGRFVR